MNPRLGEIITLVEEEAKRQGIDPAMARALVIAENSSNEGEFNPDRRIALATTSPAGAYGIGQVMPATLEGLKKQGYVSPDVDINSLGGQVSAMVGAIKEKLKYTNGDPELTAIRYNTGSNTFADFVANGRDVSRLPKETQIYRQKFLKNFQGKNTDPAAIPSTFNSMSLGTARTPIELLDVVVQKGRSFEQAAQNILTSMLGVQQSSQQTGKELMRQTSREADAGVKAKQGALDQTLAQVDARENLLKALGADAYDSDGTIYQANKAAAVAEQQILNLQPELQRLQSVSFADNPIEWLTSQFKLQATAQQYNAAAETLNNANSIVAARQNNFKTQLSMQPGVSREAVIRTAQAEMEQIQAQAQTEALRLRMQLNNQDITMLQTRMQFESVGFNNAKDIAQLAKMRYDFSQEEGIKEAERLELAQVNMYLDRIGRTGYTPNQFRLIQGAERLKLLEDSQRSSMTIGDTPGDSLTKLWDYNSFAPFVERMSPQGRKFVEDLHNAASDAAPRLVAVDPSRKLKLEDAYKKAVNQQIAEWREMLATREYDKLPSDHPVAMNAAVFARSEKLKNNSIARHVLGMPEQGAGMTVKDVLMFVDAEVGAGKPMAQVTREAREFFYEGMVQQLSEYNLAPLGIDFKNPKTNQVEFPVSRNIFGLGARLMDPRRKNPEKPMQLFNEADLEHFLTLQQTSRARTTSAPIFPGMPGVPAAVPGSEAANAGLATPRPQMPNLSFGPNITYQPDPRAPGLNAGPEAWEAYRNLQRQQRAPGQ